MANATTGPDAQPKEAPWYASLPPPKNAAPDGITHQDLLVLLKKYKSDPSSTKDFVLVDLRRTDYTGGTISTSINLPAQSLYHTIPSLHTLFKAAGIKTVIWYCGSSRGRGSRAAGWFDDYIQSQGNTEMKSIILIAGITGWANAGEEYTEFMDDYQEAPWKEGKKH